MPTFKACGEVEIPQLISLLKKVDRRCFGRSPNYFLSPTLSPSLPLCSVYLLPLQGDLQPHQRCEHRSTRRRSEAPLRCCSTASRYRDAAHCSGIRPTKLPRFHIHGVNVASCNSLGCLKAEIGENSKPIRQCFTVAPPSPSSYKRRQMDWLQCLCTNLKS